MPGTPLVNPALDPALPVVLSLQPFPLLLSHPVNRDRVQVSERHGAVALTRDGRLMHWHTPGRGARELAAVVPPGTLWKNDRFCLGPRGWYALGFDGLRARLDTVKNEAEGRKHALVILFDREGYDGPWALTASGHVISTADGRLIQFHHELGVSVEALVVSQDGHRIAVQRNRAQRPPDAGSRQAVLDLKTGRVMYPHPPNALGFLLDPAIDQQVKARGLRTRFRGITVDAEGRMVLSSRRGAWLAITVHPVRTSLVLAPVEPRPQAASQWIYAISQTIGPQCLRCSFPF